MNGAATQKQLDYLQELYSHELTKADLPKTKAEASQMIDARLEELEMSDGPDDGALYGD